MPLFLASLPEVSEEKTSLPLEGGGPPMVVEGVAHSINRSDAGAGSLHGSGQVGGHPSSIQSLLLGGGGPLAVEGVCGGRSS